MIWECSAIVRILDVSSEVAISYEFPTTGTRLLLAHVLRAAGNPFMLQNTPRGFDWRRSMHSVEQCRQVFELDQSIERLFEAAWPRHRQAKLNQASDRATSHMSDEIVKRAPSLLGRMVTGPAQQGRSLGLALSRRDGQLSVYRFSGSSASNCRPRRG